jgi:group I intron endonuclease
MATIPVGNDITWYVYKLTNPNGKVYVGLTKDLDGRRKDYEREDCKNQVAIHRSLKKYGFSNHSFEQIDQFVSSYDYALGKEIFWIRSFMSNAGKFPEQQGLNMTDGGRGSMGRKLSEETKEKLRQANIGKKYSAETKAKLSRLRTGKKIKNIWTPEKREEMRQKKLALGYKHSQEIKNIIGEASRGNKYNVGRKQSKETIEKRRKYLFGNKHNIGRKHSPELIERRIRNIKKPVLQYDLTGNFIKEHSSITDAVKNTGISIWSIRECALGNVLNPTRFIFKFKQQCH